jgi:hypothetical protein
MSIDLFAAGFVLATGRTRMAGFLSLGLVLLLLLGT